MLVVDFVTDLPARVACNCSNGVCASPTTSAACVCNAGWTRAANGTQCAACSPGYFATAEGDCLGESSPCLTYRAPLTGLLHSL